MPGCLPFSARLHSPSPPLLDYALIMVAQSPFLLCSPPCVPPATPRLLPILISRNESVRRHGNKDGEEEVKDEEQQGCRLGSLVLLGY